MENTWIKVQINILVWLITVYGLINDTRQFVQNISVF